MSSNRPEPPKNPDQKPPESNNEAELRTIQNLAIVASIAGPISLIFGGMLLSSIALVIALVALWKIRRVLKDEARVTAVTKEFKKICIIAVVGCAAAFILNTVSLVTMYPTFVETLSENINKGAFNESDVPKGIETWG